MGAPCCHSAEAEVLAPCSLHSCLGWWNPLVGREVQLPTWLSLTPTDGAAETPCHSLTRQSLHPPPAFADRVSLCGATVFSVVLWWSRTVTVLTVFSLLKLSLSWSLVRESKYLLEFLCLHPLGPWKTLFFSSKSGTYEQKRKATVRCGSNCM